MAKTESKTLTNFFILFALLIPVILAFMTGCFSPDDERNARCFFNSGIFDPFRAIGHWIGAWMAAGIRAVSS